jgi:hypothetical protein
MHISPRQEVTTEGVAIWTTGGLQQTKQTLHLWLISKAQHLLCAVNQTRTHTHTHSLLLLSSNSNCNDKVTRVCMLLSMYVLFLFISRRSQVLCLYSVQ